MKPKNKGGELSSHDVEGNYEDMVEDPIPSMDS